jgi:hypothetical protein
MHFNSLLHVRDHAKVQGTAHHLLEYIALHVNRHTGEAFELSVDRLAHRLEVTPQWVHQPRARLVAAGELEIQQSRGRRPNVYRIPYERCPACQGGNPKLESPVESNPQRPPAQPETAMPLPRNSDPSNPKLGKASGPRLAWIERPKESKDLKEKQEAATRNFTNNGLGGPEHPPANMFPKAEQASPFWCQACGFAIPTCGHRVVYGLVGGRSG